MVELRENDVELTNEQSEAKYWVKKSADGPLYEVTSDNNLPELLKVKFTSEQAAIDYVVRFLEVRKPTKRKAVKMRYEKNHAPAA